MITTLQRERIPSTYPRDVTPRSFPAAGTIIGYDGHYLVSDGMGYISMSSGLNIEGFSTEKGKICMTAPLRFNLDDDEIGDPVVIQQEHYEWVPVYSRKLF